VNIMSRSLRVGALVCVVLGAGLLWMMLAGPMLFRVKFGPLQNDSRFVLWNPLRNKEPELAGARYLTVIHSPGCREALSKLQLSDLEKQDVCEKQERRPLLNSCPMVERRDKGDAVWLLFQCSQIAHADVLADVGLSLRQRGKVWALEGYERIY
jgi:hypothetical protein